MKRPYSWRRRQAAGAAILFAATFLMLPLPVLASGDNSQIVYGPLMRALEVSYQKWITANGVPTASGFQATLNATSQPYTVKFSGTKPGSPSTTYDVSQADVLDSAWGTAPSTWTYSKGPVTLSGAYVVAFDAAYQFRQKQRPEKSHFAYLSSDASYVSIRTATWLQNGGYWVAMKQMPIGVTAVGCVLEQNYLVDPQSFGVTFEPGCLPG